jgi:hypothetical protein
VGAFRLYPTFNVSAVHDDNIYRTELSEVSTTFYEFTPRAALQSQWSRHYLVLRGGLTKWEYPDQASESRVEWDAVAEGRLDIVRAAALFGSVSYRETYEPRGTPEVVNLAARPTPFNVWSADGRLVYKPNRLATTVGAFYWRYRYGTTALFPTGFATNLDRNYSALEAFGRVAYDFSPGYAMFAHVAYNARDYVQEFDRNGVNRDSDGVRANVGVQMEVTRLISGEAYFGYLSQDYQAPLSLVSGFNYGANFTWSPDPLITFYADASHQINETVLATAGGIATSSDEKRIALAFDYGWRANVILRGDFGYLVDGYTDAGRQDRYVMLGAAATYLINRYMNAYVRYEHSVRYSTEFLEDYDDNVFRIGLGFQV